MRLNLARDTGGPQAYHRFNDDTQRPRLTLVEANGRRRSRAYVEIREIEWNPDIGAILLNMLDRRVTLYGRNLVGLCQMLEEPEIGLIQERHVRETGLDDDDIFVERMEWEEL